MRSHSSQIKAAQFLAKKEKARADKAVAENEKLALAAESAESAAPAAANQETARNPRLEAQVWTTRCLRCDRAHLTVIDRSWNVAVGHQVLKLQQALDRTRAEAADARAKVRSLKNSLAVAVQSQEKVETKVRPGRSRGAAAADAGARATYSVSARVLLRTHTFLSHANVAGLWSVCSLPR